MKVNKFRLEECRRSKSLSAYSVKSNNGSWSLPVLKHPAGSGFDKFYITRPKARFSKDYMQRIGSLAQVVGEYLINNLQDDIPPQLHHEIVKLRDEDEAAYERLAEWGYLPRSYCQTLKELSELYLAEYEKLHPHRETDDRRRGNQAPVITRSQMQIKMLCAFGYETRPESLTRKRVLSVMENLIHTKAMQNPEPHSRERRGVWSYQTRRTVLAELLRLMKWGVHKELVGFNNLANMKESDTPYLANERGCPKNPCVRETLLDERFSPDIFDEMANALSSSIEHQTLFMMCLYTGCRFSDYKDLLWSDLEYGRKSLNQEITDCWWIYKKIDRKRVAVERLWIMTLPQLSEQIGRFVNWAKANGKHEADRRVFQFVTDHHHSWNSQVARELRQYFDEAGLGLEFADFGNTLRSTFMDYATNHLGYSPSTIAKYCGTSVRVIEKYYLNNPHKNMQHANQELLDGVSLKRPIVTQPIRVFAPA